MARDVLMRVRRFMRWPMAVDRHGDKKLDADIYPLPTSLADPAHFSSVVEGLNDLAGSPHPADVEEASDIQSEVKKNLKRIVERFDVFSSVKPEVSFKKLFSTKDVDYMGEEIKLAQSLSWVAVQQSLPDGVGKLALEDYCRLGTLEYVLNFEKYLVPSDLMQAPRPPKVMVETGSWDDLFRGLVDKNICEIWPVQDLFHCQGVPLLNGVFAVGKGESVNGVETQRLIMNLTPLNSLCRSLSGDVGTLPGLSGFATFLLEEDEVAVFSSEDIRCFFYLFAVPQCWKRYMGFNKLVSTSLVPEGLQGKPCVLVSRVLPMGFANSVSIAQRVHRNVVRWTFMDPSTELGGETELRKDKGGTSAKNLFRIYLDNFDQVERLSSRTAELVKGTVSAQLLQLRQDYEALGLPRHPKKAVERKLKAEIQGALFDGLLGYAIAKPDKIWQYALLGLQLLENGRCTLKELQVVCGGFVYIAMFRRALLCSLNEVWRFMQSLKARPHDRLALPLQVQAELARFISLMPLAQMDFRDGLCDQVTCSDASTLGGGICVSEGLTAYGVSAANSQVRGDVPEEHDMIQVLTVGLFDGIGALRMAADVLGLPMAGHVSIEKDPKARRVVESWFPDTSFYEDVVTFGANEVQALAFKHSNVGVVLLGAGPPCQGVSGLNFDKKGALRDARSSLFQEVPRIHELFRTYFPWAQVHRLMESVASMSSVDRGHMSHAVDCLPYKIDCYGLTLCHRPRLYWVSWELQMGPKVMVTEPVEDAPSGLGTVSFFGSPNEKDLLEPGWALADDWGLPTFTTSRPSERPGRKPAGLDTCQPHELARCTVSRHTSTRMAQVFSTRTVNGGDLTPGKGRCSWVSQQATQYPVWARQSRKVPTTTMLGLLCWVTPGKWESLSGSLPNSCTLWAFALCGVWMMWWRHSLLVMGAHCKPSFCARLFIGRELWKPPPRWPWSRSSWDWCQSREKTCFCKPALKWQSAFTAFGPLYLPSSGNGKW